jgi:DMSO reductase family type II enzyme heme b subunit
MRLAFRSIVLFAILALLAGAACRKAATVTGEVVAVPVSTLPMEPGDPGWENVPEYAAALLPQDVVDPRLMKASTSEVRVRAVTDGSVIGFRLQWLDPRKDDMPGPGLSVDSCAVQVPRSIAKEAPSPQMGEANRPVEITLWRADWQALVNGRGNTIRDLHPNALVDHYPFQAQPLETDSPEQKAMALRYAPAKALGNQRSGQREFPVEDVVAEGPGTLRPEAGIGSRGKGVRIKDGWTVVLSRRLPAGLASGARTQVAFAVWEGSQGEIGSRKMRTGWASLLRRAEP